MNGRMRKREMVKEMMMMIGSEVLKWWWRLEEADTRIECRVGRGRRGRS